MIFRKFSIWTLLLALTMSMGLGNLGSFLANNVAYAAVQLNVQNITCTDGGGTCVLGGGGNVWGYVDGVTTNGSHINGPHHPTVIEITFAEAQDITSVSIIHSLANGSMPGNWMHTGTIEAEVDAVYSTIATFDNDAQDAVLSVSELALEGVTKLKITTTDTWGGAGWWPAEFTWEPQTGDIPTMTYTVNDLGNTTDAVHGDRECATAGDVCTLRAAIEESNDDLVPSAINFTGLSGTITLTSNIESIISPVDILGPGDSSVVIDGVDSYGGFGFSGSSDGSTLSGLEMHNCTGATPFYCVSLGDVDNITVEDMILYGAVSHHFWTNSGYVIQNNYFYDEDLDEATYGIIDMDSPVIDSTFFNNSLDCGGKSTAGMFTGSVMSLASESGNVIDSNTISNCSTNFAIATGGEDLEVTNNEVTNFTGYTAITIHTATGAGSGYTITGNVIDTVNSGGNFGRGMEFTNSWAGDSSASDVEISDNTILDTYGWGLSIFGFTSIEDVLIDGNEVSDETFVGDTGMFVSGIEFDVADSTNVRISNNILHHNRGSNLWIDSCTDGEVAVSGNSLYSSIDGSGLEMDSGADFVTINGTNNIYSNHHSGIFLNGSNSNVIEENNIYSNGADGINMTAGSTGNEVSYNEIYNNDSDGIYMDAGFNTLDHNEIYGNLGYGIYFFSSDSNTVTDNNIHDQSDYAIYLDSNADSNEFSGNTYEDNGAEPVLPEGYVANLSSVSYDGTNYGTFLNAGNNGFASAVLYGTSEDDYTRVYADDTEITTSVTGARNLDMILGTCTWGGSSTYPIFFAPADSVIDADALFEDLCNGASSAVGDAILPDVMISGGAGEDFTENLPEGMEHYASYQITNGLMSADGTDYDFGVIAINTDEVSTFSEQSARDIAVDGTRNLGVGLCSFGMNATVYFDDSVDHDAGTPGVQPVLTNTDLEELIPLLGGPASTCDADYFTTSALEAPVTPGDPYTVSLPAGVSPMEGGDLSLELGEMSATFTATYDGGDFSYTTPAVYLSDSDSNTFDGETFTNNGVGFSFNGDSVGNTVSDSEISSLGNDVYYATGEGDTNTMDNTTFSVYEMVSGLLDITFDVTAHVQDGESAPLSGATVNATDPSEEVVATAVTDLEGDAFLNNVPVTIEVGIGDLSVTNIFNYAASLAGHNTDSEDQALYTKDDSLTITLTDAEPSACGDGEDNDGDELIDFPDDPGCSSEWDNNEHDNVTPPEGHVSYVVDTINWTNDADNGDDECLDAEGNCSLLAAVEQANANEDVINDISFDVTLSGQTIVYESALPEISQPVQIVSPEVDNVTLNCGVIAEPFALYFADGSQNSVVSDVYFTGCASGIAAIRDGSTISNIHMTDGFIGMLNTVGGTVENSVFVNTSVQIGDDGDDTDTYTGNTFDGETAEFSGCINGAIGDNGVVSGNTFNNCDANALSIIGVGTDVEITNNIVNTTSSDGISIMPDVSGEMQNVTISGNQVTAAGSHGIHIYPHFGGDGNMAITNLTMDENTVTGSTGTGIRIDVILDDVYLTLSNVSILNNVVTTSGEDGLHLGNIHSSSTNISITDNEFSDAESNALYFNGEVSDELTVTGNNFADSEIGAYFDNYEGSVVFSDNTIDGNDFGLDISGGNVFDSTFSGNEITGNSIMGIYVNTIGENVEFSDNEISESGYFGIYIEDSVTNAITFNGNVLTDNGTATGGFLGDFFTPAYGGNDYTEGPWDDPAILYFGGDEPQLVMVDNTPLTLPNGTNDFDLVLVTLVPMDNAHLTFFIDEIIGLENEEDALAFCLSMIESEDPEDCSVDAFQNNVWQANGAEEDYTWDLTAEGVTITGTPALTYNSGYTYGGYYIGSSGNTLTGETVTGNGIGIAFGENAENNTISDSDVSSSLGSDFSHSSAGTNSFENTTFSTYSLLSGVAEVGFDITAHVQDAWGDLMGALITATGPDDTETEMDLTDVDGNTSSFLVSEISDTGEGDLESFNVYNFVAVLFGYSGDEVDTAITSPDQVVTITLTSATQCNDGIDNDGDTLVDTDDPQCSGRDDNDELVGVPDEEEEEENDQTGYYVTGPGTEEEEDEEDDDVEDDDNGGSEEGLPPEEVINEIEEATGSVTEFLVEVIVDPFETTDSSDPVEVIAAYEEDYEGHAAPEDVLLVPDYPPEEGGADLDQFIEGEDLSEEQQAAAETLVQESMEDSLEEVLQSQGYVPLYGVDGDVVEGGGVEVVYAPVHTEAEVQAMVEEIEARGNTALVIDNNTDLNNDGIPDVLAIAYGIPFAVDSDNDGILNADELFEGSNPRGFNTCSKLPYVTNVDGFTLGQKPSFRVTGCAGDMVELFVIPADSYDGANDDFVEEMSMGSVEVDQGRKAELTAKYAFPNGIYYVVPKGSEGYGKASKFTIDKTVDSQQIAPAILGISSLKMKQSWIVSLGTFVRIPLDAVAAASDGKFVVRDYIAAKIPQAEDIQIIKGKAAPGKHIFITMRSVVFSSVAIADAKGNFEIRVAKNKADLQNEEHSLTAYSSSALDKTIGSAMNVKIANFAIVK